jgi:hypothetical protein
MTPVPAWWRRRRRRRLVVVVVYLTMYVTHTNADCMTGNNELGRIWKEVGYLKAIPGIYLEGERFTTKNLSQDIPSQDSNEAPL